LTGNPTRLDYQSIDPRRHLLFIAHLGDSAVIVFDLKRRRILATILGISEVHGVLAVPGRGVVYASATGTNEVVGINEDTLKVIARMPGGVYPDGMALDPRNGRLFVSDERGRTETVIDTRTNSRIATVDLGGEAGNTQYDPTSGHIFVNVQTLGKLVEIDPARMTIVRSSEVTATGCRGNHGLLIDAARNQAFIACEESGTLLVINLGTRRILQTATVAEDPDVLAFDQTERRLFVASENGDVAVFTDRGAFARLSSGFFAAGAHTVAVDQSTHLIYFPLESVGGKPTLRIAEVRQ
jgi:YVTN family beta-propeller protein